MDPIIASGLVSIGEKIVSNFIPGMNSQESAATQPFSQYMPEKGPAPTGMVQELLQAHGVKDVSDLNALTFQLTQQLRNHPELADKLSKLNPNEPLTLKLKDGQFSIETLKGPIAVINKDSAIGKLAEQVHQLKSIVALNQQLPSSDVYQLAGKVATEPVLNASWSITPA